MEKGFDEVEEWTGSHEWSIWWKLSVYAVYIGPLLDVVRDLTWVKAFMACLLGMEELPEYPSIKFGYVYCNYSYSIVWYLILLC